VQWRELFSQLQVPWVERGHGLTQGRIGLRCPWCGASDPSYHLSIDEATGLYHCWRVAGHGGVSAPRLLEALGTRRSEAIQLLKEHGWMPGRVTATPGTAAPSSYLKGWERFRPAASDPQALDYLHGRGFPDPSATASLFDLRVGSGRWAQRLWFPLLYDGEVVGFTGRAMGRYEPRYLTETSAAVLYLPSSGAPAADQVNLLIVEGPFDALRLADFVRRHYNPVPLIIVALCGLSMSANKQLQLRALCRMAAHSMIVPDSTVAPTATNKLIITIAGSNPRPLPGHQLVRVLRLQLPPGIDDPGDMSEGDIEQWLMASVGGP
jgi:hypothetical protein